MTWTNNYWYIIHEITNNTKTTKEHKKETLINLSEYIPCNKCKTHFKEYISKNEITPDFVSNLKKEINISKPQKEITPTETTKKCGCKIQKNKLIHCIK